jgi:hypothetical protein
MFMDGYVLQKISLAVKLRCVARSKQVYIERMEANVFVIYLPEAALLTEATFPWDLPS